jgi:hypothetical protein
METLKEEKVLFEGVHHCLNGESFEYKVTDRDMEMREFTCSMELMEKLKREEVQPFELSRLLNQIYGNDSMSKRF